MLTNINTASSDQLAEIKRLGVTVITRIVEARAKAPFANFKDLQARVRGCGPKKVELLEGAGFGFPGGETSATPADVSEPATPEAVRKACQEL